MTRRFDPSATQTALLAGLGSVVVSASFLVLGVYHPPHPHTFLRTAVLSSSIATFALGFYLSLKFESRLKDGVANQDWDEQQIDRLRNLFESLWWKALSISLLLLAVFFLWIFRHHAALGWVFLFPSMSASRLTVAMKRPRSRKPPIDWHSFGPLSSDHWGER
jgi:hypothetical protein